MRALEKTPIVHQYLSSTTGGHPGSRWSVGCLPLCRSALHVWTWSCWLLLPWTAAAQEVWKIEDAVARTLARPEVTALREAGLESVRAEGREVLLRPAPTLDLTHEDLGNDDGATNREFSASLSAEVDLFPWRGRFEEALRHRESAFLAEDDRFRLEVATAVRTAFHAVLYHERRVAALGVWEDRLEQGWESLKAREERGDASNYEVRRVERELLVARAGRAREESMLEEAWLDLRVWCPWEEKPVLEGDLAPSLGPIGRDGPDGSNPPTDTGPSLLPDSLPDLVRLHHLELATEAERRAWGKPFLRGWEIGVGYRRVEVGSGSDEGTILSLSIPLPIWNTDGPRRDRLRAEGVRIASEMRLERQRAADALRSAEARLGRLLETASALPPPEDDTVLTSQAEAAYTGGEATLSELLEVYESAAELDLARTDVQWEARRASIELDRRRGTGVPR